MNNYMKESIEAALSLLDDDNEEHWTKLGLPSIDAVNELIEGEEKATRAMIEAVKPGFCRHMADDPVDPEGEPEPESVEEPATLVEDLNPIELMEVFCKKMQADGGQWQRYCQPLNNVMTQFLASEPTIRSTYERAKARGRL